MTDSVVFDRQTKIVYILHGLATGGTEKFVMNVVSALEKERYDVSFVLALDDNAESHQFQEDDALKMGVKIYRTCDLGSIKRWITHYKKLRKILKEEGPFDVIHCNMDLFNGINLMAAKNEKIPVRICHSHNSESQYAANSIKKIAARTYRAIMRRHIYKYATVMLGCSRLANDYLYGHRWIRDARCKVLYNGIPIGKFQTSNRKQNDGKRNFITVGRFSRQKNPLFILKILDELSKIRNDFHFIWIGNGEMEAEVKRQAKAKGIDKKISFMGRQEDVAKFLKESEFFLFPSIFEGLPITLIEAQCAGVECFVSDSVTREVDMGLCHYISLKRGSREWAEFISAKMDDKSEKKIDPEKLKQFDITNTIKKLKEIYK